MHTADLFEFCAEGLFYGKQVSDEGFGARNVLLTNQHPPFQAH